MSSNSEPVATSTPTAAEQLRDRLETRTAVIGIMGLGYVGLPLARAVHDAGYRVLGYDVDETKIGQLERGDVALDDSIRLYERGAELKKRCEAKLKEAEEKVAAITLDGEGKPAGLKPVEGL